MSVTKRPPSHFVFYCAVNCVALEPSNAHKSLVYLFMMYLIASSITGHAKNTLNPTNNLIGGVIYSLVYQSLFLVSISQRNVSASSVYVCFRLRFDASIKGLSHHTQRLSTKFHGKCYLNHQPKQLLWFFYLQKKVVRIFIAWWIIQHVYFFIVVGADVAGDFPFWMNFPH